MDCWSLLKNRKEREREIRKDRKRLNIKARLMEEIWTELIYVLPKFAWLWVTTDPTLNTHPHKVPGHVPGKSLYCLTKPIISMYKWTKSNASATQSPCIVFFMYYVLANNSPLNTNMCCSNLGSNIVLYHPATKIQSFEPFPVNTMCL